jgi:hypothetical protein
MEFYWYKYFTKERCKYIWEKNTPETHGIRIYNNEILFKGGNKFMLV